MGNYAEIIHLVLMVGTFILLRIYIGRLMVFIGGKDKTKDECQEIASCGFTVIIMILILAMLMVK